MDKTIKLEFIESSKAVSASVKLEYSGKPEEIDNKSILEESKQLFEEANKYSKRKTMEKM